MWPVERYLTLCTIWIIYPYSFLILVFHCIFSLYSQSCRSGRLTVSFSILSLFVFCVCILLLLVLMPWPGFVCKIWKSKTLKDLTLKWGYFYLVPLSGPNPVAPLPPGESRREMLRKWEVRKPEAITPNGVPTGSAGHRRTVERSWWR